MAKLAAKSTFSKPSTQEKELAKDGAKNQVDESPPQNIGPGQTFEEELNTGEDDADEDADEDDYDEEEDDDYDPSKKPDVPEADSDSSDDNEPQPDYSTINTGVSQVRTRGQRYLERSGYSNSGKSQQTGLVQNTSSIDVDSIFESLHKRAPDDWSLLVQDTSERKDAPKQEDSGNFEQKIEIVTTYTFAGKLVRELKTVDANSAEAKAYMNSTSGLMNQDKSKGNGKAYVTVMRSVPGSDAQQPLRIKLKRPSLIDKFLKGDKKNKLTTLEKSRLDWASFVDQKKIKDDLALHNKAGYLDKQEFLGRVDAKRDSQYQQARELERQRQWQQQQQSHS